MGDSRDEKKRSLRKRGGGLKSLWTKPCHYYARQPYLILYVTCVGCERKQFSLRNSSPKLREQVKFSPVNTNGCHGKNGCRSSNDVNSAIKLTQRIPIDPSL